MYVMNITNDYDSCSICTDNENVDINIIIKYSAFTIPSSILLSLISLIICSMIL